MIRRKKKSTGVQAEIAAKNREPRDQALINAVGLELRDWRDTAGFTQEHIAKFLHETSERAMVNKIETGITSISLVNYIRLVEYLMPEINPDHPVRAFHKYLRTLRRRIG